MKANNDLYIVVYNPSSKEKSTELFQALRKSFSKGAVAKKDVYLISLGDDQSVEDIKSIANKVLSIGEAIMILEVGERISTRGYPEKFNKWMDGQRERK